MGKVRRCENREGAITLLGQGMWQEWKGILLVLVLLLLGWGWGGGAGFSIAVAWNDLVELRGAGRASGGLY